MGTESTGRRLLGFGFDFMPQGSNPSLAFVRQLSWRRGSIEPKTHTAKSHTLYHALCSDAKAKLRQLFAIDVMAFLASPLHANQPLEVPMRLPALALASIFTLLGIVPVFATQTPATLKPVTLLIEGDTSTIPKFINLCRQEGPDRGLDFSFVDSKDARYDYRVILSSEGSSAWSFAHGNIVVMNPESKVMFTVNRSDRWTAKGATSALSKEFIKAISRYLGTSK